MARNGPLIVGIGASAGGVEALQSLFQTMPATLGMAFVVVMHLGTGYESALPEIIARRTKMPVLPAQDNQPIEPDHVYVLASNGILTVQRNRLRLRPQSPDALERQRHTIDVFLASLAESVGERSVAIILSGLGTDGTLGARAIKEKGGLTIAQGADHGGPSHPQMPESAISLGAIDQSLAVEEIGAKLAEYGDGHGRLDTDGQPRSRRNHIDGARQTICQLLLDRVGHNFAGYKERTFLRRVERRMQVLELRDIERYVARLREDPGEAAQLFHDLLIGVTAFFRDQEAFDSLAEKVLPRLFEGESSGDLVRVWVPGCSTGEEVYSIAILLLEQQAKQALRATVQCFATDIDDAAVAVARAGRYPVTMARDIPPALLDRYFTGNAETVTVSKHVRDVCVFSSHSLIRDPPFSRIDLISCRNLLIYLDSALQNQLIPMFHYALRPSGYLFLGNSENLSRHSDYFTTIDSKHRIFQRRDDAARHGFFPVAIAARRPSRATLQSIGLNPEVLSLRQSSEKRILERFAPAHVVINRNGDVLHYSTRTGKYLENASGAPSRQLVSLARRGLRIDLPAALAEAVETNRRVMRQGIDVDVDDVIQTIDLTIEPLTEQAGESAFLVIFNDVGPPHLPGEPPVAGAKPDGHHVDQLENDLRDARERLQSMIEEYETALEELKSANEELISTNEELQSTNEELETSREETQSINEELHTVNNELQRKVEELDRANEDLRALFDSSPIGMVFLDHSLTIQTFTPAVTRIFNLLPGDRGRPLTDITHDLEDIDLHAELEAAFRSRQPRERRVTRRGGASHLMRIQPDRSGERLLVSFAEISATVAAEQRQREQAESWRTILDLALRFTEARRSAPDADAGSAKPLTERLRNLSGLYNLLVEAEWGEVGLRDLARRQFGQVGIGADARVAVEGTDVALKPKAAIAVGAALHELAADAVRHGALSVPQGAVRLSWSVSEAGAATAELAIEWRETGMPRPPAAADAAHALIEPQLAAAVGARGSLEAQPDGLVARIAVPLASGLVVAPGEARIG